MNDGNGPTEEEKLLYRARIIRITKNDLKQLFRIATRMNGIKHLIKKFVEVESHCFNEPIFEEEDLVSFKKPKLSNYYKMCQAEVAAMNYHKFEGTLITHLDVFAVILTNPSMDESARYKNSHIEKEFKTKNYESLYPIYATKLKLRFQELKKLKTSPETWDKKMENYMRFRMREYVQRMFEAGEEYEMSETNLPMIIQQLGRYIRVTQMVFMQQFFVERETLLAKRRKISNYYTECQSELTAMENHKFEGISLTYIDLLQKPVELLARYARNEQFLKEFATKHYETLYPIYGTKLKMKFNKTLARRTLIENVSNVLSENLQFAGSDHVAIEKIVEHLSKEDMELIVSSAKI